MPERISHPQLGLSIFFAQLSTRDQTTDAARRRCEGALPLVLSAIFVFAISINSIRFALHPREVESLRCEITVRCVGAGVCGFDDGVKSRDMKKSFVFFVLALAARACVAQTVYT